VFSGDKRGSKRITASGSYEKNSSDSIAEESHLQGPDASRGSSSKQKNSGVIEESIHESVISNDGGSNSGSGVLPSRKQQEE
jgi:hypothetical protein